MKGGEFRCVFCPGTTFRRSRLRLKDMAPLLMLRYPVRCLRCSQRQLVSYSLAGISVAAHIKHQRLPTEAESWKSWTAGEEGTAAKSYAPSPAAPAYSSVVDKGPRPRRKPAPTAVKPPSDRAGDIW